MRLERLTLEHFRNYAALDLDLSGGALHLFVGQNGSGKTNLLESVSVLSLTRSCKSIDEQDLAGFGSGFYRVRGQASGDAGDPLRLEVVGEVAPRRRKACFLNDVRVGVTEAVGRLPSVVFLPEDMQLFTGPPAERRRFLDLLLCQVSPEYLAALSEYQRVLKQRNSLLKAVAAGRSSEADITLWDRALVGPGSLITLARLELIETLNLSLGRELMALGEQVTEALIAYERKGSARDRGALEEEMLALLLASRERDLILESTGAGPHRDDWQVVADGRPVARFASRGQQRVCMIALLFLQVSYLELRKGERPVILLDDVFSELDDERQSLLVEEMGEYQVLLTGTHLPPTLTGARLWKVEAGVVAPARQSDLPERVTLDRHG